jgi:hypothetical protein
VAVAPQATTGPISKAWCGWHGRVRSGGICRTSTASGTAYRRWVLSGVFEAMLETLAAVVERDTTADMIDSTVVRAHHCAVGLKKGIGRPRGLVDREVALRPSCTPAAMVRDGCYALS